jgi:hypothetical protein
MLEPLEVTAKFHPEPTARHTQSGAEIQLPHGIRKATHAVIQFGPFGRMDVIVPEEKSGPYLEARFTGTHEQLAPFFEALRELAGVDLVPNDPFKPTPEQERQHGRAARVFEHGGVLNVELRKTQPKDVDVLQKMQGLPPDAEVRTLWWSYQHPWSPQHLTRLSLKLRDAEKANAPGLRLLPEDVLKALHAAAQRATNPER